MNIGLDLDGTLISCMQKQTTLMKTLLSAHQVSIDICKYWSFKREGMNNIQALKNCRVDENLVNLLNKQWMDQIEAVQWMELDSILEGTIAFLNNQQKQTNKLYLISSRSNKANSLLQVEKLSLAKYFDTIDFVSNSLGEDKKNIFLSRKINIYIGDTEQDLKQSQSANIKCLLVASGMRSKEFLRSLGVPVFTSLSEIDI